MLGQQRVRDLLPGYGTGSLCNYMTRTVNQLKIVIAAEVVANRVQRSRNGDNFLSVKRRIGTHQQADKPDEKGPDCRAGLPNAVPRRSVDRSSPIS
jgi:hypothetical protein